MAAQYELIGVVRRGLVSLRLQRRTDLEPRHFVMSWRQQRDGTHSNRRFYFESSFWEIPLDVVYSMLREASAKGYLNEKYYIPNKNSIEFCDSLKMSGADKSKLLKIVLTDYVDDNKWRKYDDLRIISCYEPHKYGFNKVMIFSESNNRMTFRSLTRSDLYPLRYVNRFRVNDGWYLDRAMFDADPRFFQLYYTVLS